MNTELEIRVAMKEDAERLLEIYTPYVIDTAITFEYEVPSVEEFRDRIVHTLQTYPYIVAVKENKIVGYAYASAFKSRAAYDWAVETSIYVDVDEKRGGVGSKLYEHLEAYLKQQGILNVNACIAYPEVEDEHLTKDSVLFHEKCGYRMVGEFHQCGYKYNRWYNMVWMEKFIGEHVQKQPPIIKFSELSFYEKRKNA